MISQVLKLMEGFRILKIAHLKRKNDYSMCASKTVFSKVIVKV